MLERMEFEEFLPQSTHMGLLADLITKDGQCQQDLVVSTIKDKGTVARALNGLEAAAIVRREADPEDGRQKRIYLTEKGMRLCVYAREHAEYAMECARQNISPEELEICTDVLGKIYHNLHQQLSIPQNTNHE